MNLELTQEEATFLGAQLERRLQTLQAEVAATESRPMQHEIAIDIRRIEVLVGRLRRFNAEIPAYG